MNVIGSFNYCHVTPTLLLSLLIKMLINRHQRVTASDIFFHHHLPLLSPQAPTLYKTHSAPGHYHNMNALSIA